MLCGAFRPAGSAAAKHLAPADAYFGRMKMSFLGILNEYKGISIRAGAHTTDANLIHKLRFAEESLEDWAKKHPKDSQVPRTYYIASEVYKKFWTVEFQGKAWTYMQLVVKRYPQTFYGKQVTNDIAGGFTQHYYAAPVACSSGSPQPEPPPSGTPAPSKTQPKVQLETPPCIPAETPAPSAAPSSAASASAPAALEGTHWALAELAGTALDATRLALGADVTFDAAAHRAIGSTGCNRFTTTYELAEGAIHFGPVPTTRMACQAPAADQEGAVLAALAAVRTWQIDGNVLTLRDDAGKDVAKFRIAAKP